MKAGVAAVFLLALFIGVLGDFRRRVDSLQQKLESIPAPPADDLRLAAGHDIDALYRDVLFPSVQIHGKGGIGGGTLLYSRKDRTYAMTAFHVVQKGVVKKEDGGEQREPVDVTVYDARGEPQETVPSDIVAYDEKKDLALLHLNTDKVFPHVARLASRPTLQKVKVFTPVYAVGCPLGHPPLPTIGEVATLHKEVGEERFWMMNAPTIFGNSGGGIFHRDTREMIGVSVMVCTYDDVISTPVPHLGILVSLETVYDWLDGLHYDFVYNPRRTPEECERARASTVPGPPPTRTTFDMIK